MNAVLSVQRVEGRADLTDKIQGMVDGETMLSYADASQATALIEAVLAEPKRLARIAAAGHREMATRYSKAQQWQAVQQLVADL